MIMTLPQPGNGLLPDHTQQIPKSILTWYQWELFVIKRQVITGSADGLLTAGTKPLPEPMLTYQRNPE